ncbi:MAG: DUF3806 domain-containing protein [Limnohabitans sp.]|nr:DUF3806 domain-containing protein [Limnohabitans sp.]
MKSIFNYLITIVSMLLSYNSFSQQKVKKLVIKNKEIKYYHPKIKMGPNPKIEELNKDLKIFIQDNLGLLSDLTNYYDLSLNNPEINFPQFLDKIFKLWKDDSNSKKPTEEEIISILGASFGDYIIKNLNFEWKLLTDKDGTDIILKHKKYQVTLFPFNSVEKACKEEKMDFFEAIYLFTVNELSTNKNKLETN